MFILILIAVAIFTDLFILVAVAIAPLGECLVTVGAQIGSSSLMSSHMVYNIAKLKKLLMAGEAVEDLVEASGLSVHYLRLLVSFTFTDHLPQVVNSVFRLSDIL